jgi:hypothetical protein
MGGERDINIELDGLRGRSQTPVLRADVRYPAIGRDVIETRLFHELQQQDGKRRPSRGVEARHWRSHLVGLVVGRQRPQQSQKVRSLSRGDG